jgi:hypothetical protein
MKKAGMAKSISMIMLVAGALFFVSFFPKEKIKKVENLSAKPGSWFSFAKDKEVAETEAWELSFNSTTIAINQGVEAQILEVAFDELTSVPQSGFSADSKKAIPPGSGNGWYKYSMRDHSITPLPGKVIVVKTLSGTYVKVEVLSYYKDLNGDSGYYTFRYAPLED